MLRKIVAFHIDKEQHWVADLVCGHRQHVRHVPPLMRRDWVLSEEGRQSRIGTELNCLHCDESLLGRNHGDEMGKNSITNKNLNDDHEET